MAEMFTKMNEALPFSYQLAFLLRVLVATLCGGAIGFERTKRLKEAGIRTSIFVDPDAKMVEGAKACGADRVELYTEPYASGYATNRDEAIKPFVEAAIEARQLLMGLNAGHDLSLENLHFFHQMIPWVDEVSIGHALICDALYMGLRETIKLYLACLK